MSNSHTTFVTIIAIILVVAGAGFGTYILNTDQSAKAKGDEQAESSTAFNRNKSNVRLGST